MSSVLNHLFDLSEQICYVQCGFCTTILLVHIYTSSNFSLLSTSLSSFFLFICLYIMQVSVPSSSLSVVVTVRCGHCTSLLSVNMTNASFLPLHLLTPFIQEEVCILISDCLSSSIFLSIVSLLLDPTLKTICLYHTSI